MKRTANLVLLNDEAAWKKGAMLSHTTVAIYVHIDDVGIFLAALR